MFLIESNTTNPYFNIAAEEYLLKNFTEDFFVLYQNEPSIIVGKHQNTLNEINYSFVKENNIPVIRRLSGGGTVYHDLGNLNFAFFKDTENDKNTVDFKKHTEPIIKALNQLGVNAKFEGHNDIRVNGFKVSGNAEHVFKKRVLHHGTLLFSSDLTVLNKSINAPANKFTDKAVKSVRSNVANIQDFIDKKISIDVFKKKLVQVVCSEFSNVMPFAFNQNDQLEIQRLIDEKYSTWNWNYGYSPDYNYVSKLKIDDALAEIFLQVEKGMIKEIRISGIPDNQLLENLLIGVKHDESIVRKTLMECHHNNNMILDIDLIINALFGSC
ncbi:MAG: lipoate--protein ligase [Bacteroidales bacterium]|jgi:lipoate-protein ligase A|nr:lipoate--protein ligase [Bacteroidales bacterium]